MPHFEETYGFAPEQMTERERFIALYGALHDLKLDHKQAIDGIYKRLDETNGKVRCIPQMKLYWKVLFALTPIITGVIGWMLFNIVDLLKRI